jgi:hypothetical protein
VGDVVTEEAQMCTYITGVVPKGVDLDAVTRDVPESIRKPLGIRLKPENGSHVRGGIRPNEVHVRMTDNDCDCGTVLGSSRSDVPLWTGPTASELEDLRSKGWSKTKIGRWVEQKRQTLRRNVRVEHQREALSQERMEFWRDFIRSVVVDSGVERLGLILHWYSDSRLCIKSRKSVRLSDLTDSLLARMEYDVIYDFRR